MNRRQALQTLALASVGGALAGCSSGGSGSPTAGTKSTSQQQGSSATVAPNADGVLLVDAARMHPGSATRAGADLTSFGVRLLLHDAQIGATANGSISPYSVYAALAMTDAGALGTTESELARVLGGDQLQQAGTITAVDAAVAKAVHASRSAGGTPAVVQAANSLWTDRQLAVHRTYLRALATGYGAQMHAVGFQHDPNAARQQINAWVSGRTHRLIPQLLGPQAVTSATRLELVNALYLKAAWATAFGKPGAPQSFTTAAGRQVSVPYMVVESGLPTAQGADWSSVSVPYAGAGMAMTIILPAKGAFGSVRAALASVVPRAAHGTLGPQVQLSMPAFATDTTSALAPALQSLGVTRLFTPGADLSAIAGRPGQLRVDSVTHQSVVKVDRNGTEAAAATAVGMGIGAVQQRPTQIVVDRAFFFVIHDTTTAAPLFLGQVADPS